MVPSREIIAKTPTCCRMMARILERPSKIPETGVLCDLLWSDPEIDIQGWGDNDRGVSFTFGENVIRKFNAKHDIDLICRAHQVVEDGYEFF